MSLGRKPRTLGAGGPDRFQELYIHFSSYPGILCLCCVFSGGNNPKKELKTLLDLQ